MNIPKEIEELEREIGKSGISQRYRVTCATRIYELKRFEKLVEELKESISRNINLHRLPLQEEINKLFYSDK